MEKQSTNDEIDLGLVFKKIGEAWRWFLVRLYHSIQFLKRNWIVLFVLIALGVGLGYIWEQNSKTSKTATLIIQTNFGSSNYVYNKLNRVRKIAGLEKGKKYGFEGVESPIKKIEITPIVDIIDLTQRINTDDRSLEEFMAQADFVDDLLTSDVFLNEYKYHILEVTTTEDGTNQTLDAIFNFLNDSETYDVVKEIAKQETQEKIKNHRKSIEGIDQLFLSFIETEEGINPSFVFKNNEVINLHRVLQEKKSIMEYIQDERVNLSRLDNVVVPISEKELLYSFSFLDLKMVLTPFLLIILFMAFLWLKNLYKQGKKLA